MEVLEDIDGQNDINEIFQNAYIDTESLKNLKETSQAFLEVNNFDLGKEPSFKDHDEEYFVKYIENNINEEIIAKFGESNIKEDFRSSMSNIYHGKNKKSKIFVFFLPTSSTGSNVGIDVVKNFFKLIYIFQCTDGILISEKQLTSIAKERLEHSNSVSSESENSFNIINYIDDEFINITDHCLSPDIMKIYSGEELADFLEKEKITIKEFPRITNNDPVVKFYRAKVGDLIKMKRKTGISNSLVNEQIIFRAVVHTQFKNKK